MEDFFKMKGEETLYQLLLTLQTGDETPLLMNTIVTIATMYKNTISLSDYSTSQQVLKSLLDRMQTARSSQFKKKLLYSMNTMIAGKKAMGEFFIQQEGVSLIEQFILGSDVELKRKGLAVYMNLLQMFEENPVVATSNVCSQALADLTARENQEDYPLLQAYFELFK